MQMKKAEKGKATDGVPTRISRNGIWAINELKRVTRAEEMHVIGVDPGKRELVVCVDTDNQKAAPVRYTQKQRQFETCSKQYKYETIRDMPERVKRHEAELAGFNSRSSDMATFAAYCSKRRSGMDAWLAFYAPCSNRKRRWKGAIKTQQSEERLYKRIEGMQEKGDKRKIVLAYGSWGMVAGRTDAACNKGNPPCIGVGLMRKLARRFVVSLTPEAFTSKTCSFCLGPCGPWKEVEERRGKRIRGLRLCQTETCKLPLNRDKNGAANIGTNFLRLFRGQGPIRSMSEDDIRLHKFNHCVECD